MRENASVRKLRKEMAQELAKRTRERKKEALKQVLSKEKVETYGDIFAIFDGLSKKAVEKTALDKIFTLAHLGNSPAEIIKLMEPKKDTKNGKTSL
jgi:Ca2+-binding EF-hand superfamily protein